MEKENNILDQKDINEIAERLLNSKKPEIEMERIVGKSFETLINGSKILSNIKKEIEITLENADNAKEEIMDAGTNDYKTSVFNISFFKSSTEESIKKNAGVNLLFIKCCYRYK